MKLELEFGNAYCYTRIFNINGIDADRDDFGYQSDHDPENAEDYGCGDMRFERKIATPEILGKYGINEAEYELIAGMLENGLSFGSCGWCI